ncbi:hypothetical protein [Terrimonas alba]|uniref:hypothetical protein n=1 Tax=Terrimonas alba TaxID=3349636 RepID=UPI0035F4FB5D
MSKAYPHPGKLFLFRISVIFADVMAKWKALKTKRSCYTVTPFAVLSFGRIFDDLTYLSEDSGTRELRIHPQTKNIYEL